MSLKDIVCKIVNSIIDEKDDSIKIGSLETCSSDSECNPDLCDKTRGKCFKYIKHNENSAYPIDIFVRQMFESFDYSEPFEYMLKTLEMSDCISLIHVGYFTDKNNDNKSRFVHIKKETLSSFYYKYSGTSCIGFSVIDIYIKNNDNEAHINVILVENIKDFLIWNYYEPHGYEDGINTSYINEMGELCAKIAGKKFIFNQREGAQCPRGIQGLLTEYDPGYCLIFSYFWMWCVLNVIKKMDKYIPSNQWISYVEECVADYIKSDQKLVYKRVISFAYKMHTPSNETLKESDSLTGKYFKKRFEISVDDYNERVSLSEIGKNRGKYGEQFANGKDESDQSDTEDDELEEESELAIAKNKTLSYIYNHLNKDDKVILLKSVENGMVKKIEQLYNSGADIKELITQLNYFNMQAGGENALKYASKDGNLPIVQYLVENGADIQIDNNAAFRAASENGHLSVVQYLVEKGADIHAKNDYAFRIASARGHLSVVKYLMDKGVDVHVNNDFAIVNASATNRLLVVQYLVENIEFKRDVLEYAFNMARINNSNSVFTYLEGVLSKKK